MGTLRLAFVAALFPWKNGFGLVSIPLRRLQESGTPHPEGVVPLSNIGNVQYVGTVVIGTPGQELQMIFDTGSSDVWVPGSDCETCGTHRRFYPTLSTTYTSTGDVFDDEYGSGMVSGVIGQDSVRWGGFVVENVRFGLVQQEDSMISSFKTDGVVGMAFGGLSLVTKPTLVEELANQFMDTVGTNAYCFSFFLHSENSAQQSTLTVGGYNLSMLGENASLYFTPVIELPGVFGITYWAIGISAMSIGKEVFCTAPSSCTGIVDTGTSLIGVPEIEFVRVATALTARHVCSINGILLDPEGVGAANVAAAAAADNAPHSDGIICENCQLHLFPTLTIALPPVGSTFALQPRDYVRFVLDGGPAEARGECILPFMVTSQRNSWVLGDVFMMAYYTVFDATPGAMKVGFACAGAVAAGNKSNGIDGVGVEASSWWVAGAGAAGSNGRSASAFACAGGDTFVERGVRATGIGGWAWASASGSSTPLPGLSSSAWQSAIMVGGVTAMASLAIFTIYQLHMAEFDPVEATPLLIGTHSGTHMRTADYAHGKYSTSHTRGGSRVGGSYYSGSGTTSVPTGDDFDEDYVAGVVGGKERQSDTFDNEFDDVSMYGLGAVPDVYEIAESSESTDRIHGGAPTRRAAMHTMHTSPAVGASLPGRERGGRHRGGRSSLPIL
jgi:hypothetical protein